MNHTLSDSQLEAMIKSAVNSSGPLPPDEKFSQLILALRELQERRKAAMDSKPVAWGNGCDKTVPAALRYLAENERPFGGESRFNAAHLYQLAREIELMAEAPLYRHAQPGPERDRVRREHAEWSQATFGNVGPIGPLKHLSKEALEAAGEPDDLSEWADMQFLLWDAQRRAGITDEQITQAMIEKLAVNKQREWPEPKDGEPRLHIKDQPSAIGPVTDAMAYAFHHALTDGPLGDDDVEDIKIGLRAAFANVTTYQPLPVVLKEHQIRELVNKLRDIAIEYHGTQQLREHIACVIRTAMNAVAPPAPKSAVI